MGERLVQIENLHCRASTFCVVILLGNFDNLFIADPPPLPAGLETEEPDTKTTVQSFIEGSGLGRCALVINTLCTHHVELHGYRYVFAQSASWTKLPDTFFPSYYSGSKCDNKNQAPSCSFPEGMLCEPNIRYVRQPHKYVCSSHFSNNSSKGPRNNLYKQTLL